MLKFYKSILIVIIIIQSIFIIVNSISLSEMYGGTDLRCRVVGARLLDKSISPYYYKWNPEDGDYLLDPNDAPNRIVNGNTATPAILYLVKPISTFQYQNVRLGWTTIQLILVILSIFFLIKTDDNKNNIIYQLLILLSFLCSDIWFYNIERGQIYIFFSFLFILMYWLYKQNSRVGFILSGLIGGLFVFFRPISIIIALPFILNFKKNIFWLSGFGLGIIMGCILFIVPNPKLWEDYFSAMKVYESISEIPFHYTIESTNTIWQNKTIEEVKNLTYYKSFIKSGGMRTIADYLHIAGISIKNNEVIAFYLFLVMILNFLYYQKKGTCSSIDRSFIYAFFLYNLLEIILVAPRGGYSFIQWIFPIWVLGKYLFNDKFLMGIYLSAILLTFHFPFDFNYQKDLSELLLMLIVLILLFFNQDKNQNVKQIRSDYITN